MLAGIAVLLAGNVRLLGLGVLVDVVFCAEELLGFIDGGIEFQEAQALALLHAGVGDACGGEPGADGGYCLLAERLSGLDRSQ